jgi:hypothetical protein
LSRGIDQQSRAMLRLEPVHVTAGDDDAVVSGELTD